MKYLFVFLLTILTGVSNAQSENAKQLSCNEIDGLQFQKTFYDDTISPKDMELIEQWDIKLKKEIPNDYTGIVSSCVNNKLECFWGYKDGIKDGLCRSWFSNGQLREEGYMKEGQLDSLFRTFDKNGSLYTEGFFKNGKANGIGRVWGSDGHLASEGHWINGNKIGSHKKWFINGQLYYEANYKDGTLTIEKKWDENGILRHQLKYKDGREYELKTWDENGNVEKTRIF